MWTHSGSLEPRELASALDDYLLRSPAARVPQITSGMTLGMQLSPLAFDVDVNTRLSDIERACPPPPFGRLGTQATVAFVGRGSTAAEVAVRTIADDHASRGDESSLIVVVDGAEADDVERLRPSLPEGVTLLPDAEGVISRRFGVRMWPTNIAINENGLVTAIEIGLDATEHAPRSGDAS
jgi:hypothetical protein